MATWLFELGPHPLWVLVGIPLRKLFFANAANYLQEWGTELQKVKVAQALQMLQLSRRRFNLSREASFEAPVQGGMLKKDVYKLPHVAARLPPLSKRNIL